MILLAYVALCLSISLPISLLSNTSNLASSLQQNCVRILPQASTERASLASLLCGQKITDENLRQKLQQTSLIHIFVISGSHLILFDQLLGTLRIPLFLRFAFLLLYSLATGWQPPAVRALCGLLLLALLRWRGWPFASDQRVLLTGMTVLATFPEWWESRSLIMSWCASLALCTPSLFRLQLSLPRLFWGQVAIFILMTPPLWGFGNLHPLGLVYNLLLGPVVSFILLPLAIVAVILPASSPLFDFLLGLFTEGLHRVSDPIQLPSGTAVSIPLLWGWVFGVHLLFHIVRVQRWQGRHR